jgi:copine 5/8/9
MFITTFKELKQKEFDLIDKKNKVSGVLKINTFKIVEVPNFLQYLYDGLEISLLLSIDFTGSNGHPSKTTSLHYRTKEKLNDYQRSIIDVGNIVMSYDDDGILIFC